MASSNNLAAIEPWMFRSTSTLAADSWYPDAFARETESALTKALQQSFFDQSQLNRPISSSFLANRSDYCTPSASTVTRSGSASDPETPGSKRNLGVKSTKRKSRASKRSMTTFIQADPANFRRMVQEVTGVKLEGNNGKLPAVVRPEPIRQPFVNKLQGLLPTLDTSACLLDLPSSNTHRSSCSGYELSGNGGFSQIPAMSQVTGNGGGGIDFGSFCSFPTLESSIKL